ncbi:hypothetical protein V8E51_015853 [Hyaloscypha variabilis]
MELRSHLAAYKTAVNLALAMANLANVSQNLSATERIETEIQHMGVHLDELALNQEDSGDSAVGDNGSLLNRDTDRGYALR